MDIRVRNATRSNGISAGISSAAFRHVISYINSLGGPISAVRRADREHQSKNHDLSRKNNLVANYDFHWIRSGVVAGPRMGAVYDTAG